MQVHKPLAIAILLAAPLSTMARADSDALKGRALAEEWCTRCHNIEPEAPWQLYPPSFASIAVFRSTDHIRAQIAWSPIHTGMPQLGHILTPQNVDELVAYIVSLEKR